MTVAPIKRQKYTVYYSFINRALLKIFSKPTRMLVILLPRLCTAFWTFYFYSIRRHGMHTQNILPQNGGTPSQPSILFCHWIEPVSCTWLVGPVFAFENTLSPCPAVTMPLSSGYWSPRVSLTCCTNRRAPSDWHSLLLLSASRGFLCTGEGVYGHWPSPRPILEPNEGGRLPETGR